MTTISKIVNGTKNKKSFPDCSLIDGKAVDDKLTIANRLKCFFTNIDPALAKIIVEPNNINFTEYLYAQCDPNFTEKTVEKVFDNLTPKNRPDGILLAY